MRTFIGNKEELSEEIKLPYILFNLGQNTYAINYENIVYIDMFESITSRVKVFSSQNMMTLNDKIISLINLRKLFNLLPLENIKNQMIIVVSNNNREIGLIVDEVLGMDFLKDEMIYTNGSGYVEAIYKPVNKELIDNNLILKLNLSKII